MAARYEDMWQLRGLPITMPLSSVTSHIGLAALGRTCRARRANIARGLRQRRPAVHVTQQLPLTYKRPGHYFHPVNLHIQQQGSPTRPIDGLRLAWD